MELKAGAVDQMVVETALEEVKREVTEGVAWKEMMAVG